MVACPICDQPVKEININRHIDSECRDLIDEPSPPSTQSNGFKPKSSSSSSKAASFFTPAAKRVSFKEEGSYVGSSPTPCQGDETKKEDDGSKPILESFPHGTKRSLENEDSQPTPIERPAESFPSLKKQKKSPAPLAERMRPRTLDEVAGQGLVDRNGILRHLIQTDRVPSMILWGGPGTGKTTIARLIAQTAGTRFVEINSTSSGVGECKKIFAEAKNETGLTGRKTIVFCDEIHRFSKSQQDVFLGPVEAGEITLIGATTENPSFKVIKPLLSRCRTFTLSKLTDRDIEEILKRALNLEAPDMPLHSSPVSQEYGEKSEQKGTGTSRHLLNENDFELLRYLATFADGDARTALNLLELALDLCQRPSVTAEEIKKSLTRTLVYDRAGDQHYDTISAFHKSVRGSNADAALYYLARMLQSGEDPLFVARRMVVIASEDVGLADNSMLSLATATYTAAEKIGMPECRINLAHCAVALCQAPKSVRAYRGLNAAYAALDEPGIAGLPVPIHIRNAPTKLMKELGYGKEYKYNPDYVDGRVVQDYLPEKLEGRKFLGAKDLGDQIDPEIAEFDEQSRLVEEAGDEEILLGPDGD
ncbi:DNA-dependent ATPase MGS1 [Acrodontium crateriforme]|uniref:DNA-dependent ATPase MGS1 n=1 Tax=Acrodontium crateriforme TaxID=150365 RepID=A0AAQ3M7M3_9PEZI|nr:DNA-dependent ATPase MGS1 [Acrodontium crateriforme]